MGEQAAADYLRKSGYLILARKYRGKTGEIDIIAKIKDVIVFVEVKTRRSRVFGLPAEAVTYCKQRKILQTALCYLKQTGNNDAACRFDVLEILLSPQGRLEYNHIINAFGN